MAISDDGESVAGGGSALTTRVWELRTGRRVATFAFHGGRVASIAFSPDGRRVLTASADGAARIFECEACASADALAQLADERLSRLLTPDQRAAKLGAATG